MLEQTIQFSDLPDTVFYEIAGHLNTNDINALIQTGHISEHFSNFIAIQTEDELSKKILNNPIFELRFLYGFSIREDVFLSELKNLKRDIQKFVEAALSRDKLLNQVQRKVLNHQALIYEIFECLLQQPGHAEYLVSAIAVLHRAKLLTQENCEVLLAFSEHARSLASALSSLHSANLLTGICQ